MYTKHVSCIYLRVRTKRARWACATAPEDGCTRARIPVTASHLRALNAQVFIWFIPVHACIFILPHHTAVTYMPKIPVPLPLPLSLISLHPLIVSYVSFELIDFSDLGCNLQREFRCANCFKGCMGFVSGVCAACNRVPNVASLLTISCIAETVRQ
jgi:hypothetical protein